MSRLKFLKQYGLSPILRLTNTQQHLCDKGGGIILTRNASAEPCQTEGGVKEKMNLKCKVALVTGGATGIGYEIANALLHEGLYRVVIADLDPCTGLKAAHRLGEVHGDNKCCYVPLNVACIKQLEGVMKKVQSTYTNLDIVVNNAAIVDNGNMDLEMDTNLRPIFHGTKIAFKLMKSQKNKGGLIINIGDTKGLEACKFFPSYAAEKSGVHKYSMGIGRDSVPKSSVRVIALAPGLTESKMGDEFVHKPDPECMKQRACMVGKAVVYTAKHGDSGSLWVVEKRKLYKANWPHRSTYLDLVMCL